MDWIASKMKENLASPRQFVSYSNGIFICKKEYRPGIWFTSTLDLNKVSGMRNEYPDDFYVVGKALIQTICQGDEHLTDYDYSALYWCKIERLGFLLPTFQT